MTKEQFIEKIAPIIVKYAPKYNILCPSAVISQAVLESAGGTSELAVNAHNYFGLKYRPGRCPTASGIYYKVGSEQNADGTYSSSAMQWMSFNSMEDGIRGYYDFVNISNYASIKGVSDPKTYLENIKKAGYATSLKYVENLLNVIDKYNLTRFDPKDNNKEVSPLGYTNSPLVTYTNISPNRTSPRNHKIDCITIHCIVGQWTAKQGCDYFATTNRNASANYVVGKDGSIGLSTPEGDRSWCSSSAINDHRAITIEVASDTVSPYAVTDKALKALIDLCADICKRNGIKKLVWSTNKSDRINHLNGCNMTVHRDFANKACPGDYLYNKHGYIADEVNKKLGVSTSYATSTPSSTTSSSTSTTLQKGSTGQAVKELQENLNYLGYSCGTVDGSFGTNTYNALVKFQKANGLTADGIYGSASKAKMAEAIAKKKSSSSTTTSFVHNGLDYSLVFDPTYYSNRYGDLKKAFGTDSKKLFSHFVQYGMAEGRVASVRFNVQAYKRRYLDLQNAFGNDLPKYYRHYIEYGKRENRTAI